MNYKAQDSEAARIAALSALVSSVTRLADAMERLASFNAKNGDQTSSDLAASSNAAFTACVAVACIGIVLAIALGISLTVIITRPLKKMT